jgi:hypothetical protein
MQGHARVIKTCVRARAHRVHPQRRGAHALATSPPPRALQEKLRQAHAQLSCDTAAAEQGLAALRQAAEAVAAGRPATLRTTADLARQTELQRGKQAQYERSLQDAEQKLVALEFHDQVRALTATSTRAAGPRHTQQGGWGRPA